MTLNTIRHPIFVLIGSIACLIILMVFTFRQFRKYELHTAQVEHTYQVISALQNIRGYFATEAYMRRGYVLFPNPQVEENARRVRDDLFAEVGTLRALIDDNEIQKANTYRLAGMLADTTLSMNKWNLYLQQDSSQRIGYMKRDIARTIGFQRHDAIYRLIEDMLRQESALFLERSKLQQASARTTPLLFLSLTTAALIFLLYSFWQIQREFLTKTKVQRALEHTLSNLEVKNKELERLSLLTAHHLREPLRKTQTFISRVTDRADLEAADQYALQRATANLERMQDLLHDLNQYYMYTLREGQELVAVDLNKSVKHAMHTLRTDISKSKAQVEMIGILPLVAGEIEGLQFVFREIIFNALKYHREGMPPQIEIWALTDRPTHAWLVHVKDYGLGIEAAYQERIFQVFERLHTAQQYAGTGIGLAICQRIMEAYGGSIRVESEAGAYTTFTLVFPLAQKIG